MVAGACGTVTVRGRCRRAGQRSTGRTATEVAESAASTQTSAPRATGTALFAASFTRLPGEMQQHLAVAVGGNGGDHGARTCRRGRSPRGVAAVWSRIRARLNFQVSHPVPTPASDADTGGGTGPEAGGAQHDRAAEAEHRHESGDHRQRQQPVEEAVQAPPKTPSSTPSKTSDSTSSTIPAMPRPRNQVTLDALPRSLESLEQEGSSHA